MSGSAAPPFVLPLPAGLHLRRMTSDDLDAVMAVEACAYAHPWSRGNFSDSIAAGHSAWILVQSSLEAPEEVEAEGKAGGPSAYCVAMRGVAEWHLLNLTVAPHRQRQGLARTLLQALAQAARADAAQRILLEVRASNERAQAVYAACGFQIIGRRRAYYPALRGQREDALVWAWTLEPANAV